MSILLKEYLNKVYQEQDDLPTKRISILVNDYEVDDEGNPTGVVSKRIEGNNLQEFKMDFEQKFGKPMSPDMQQAFVKIFQAAIERAKEAGVTGAEVDAAVLPKGMSGEKWAKQTGRNMVRH
jgi:hypothetical protein